MADSTTTGHLPTSALNVASLSEDGHLLVAYAGEAPGDAHDGAATIDGAAGELLDHGGGYGHGPELGRYITHPPEPPHLLMIWYKHEQKQLIADYYEEHGGEKPSVVEHWLTKDENGEWVAKEGESPTLAQVLHAGTATKPLPLFNYLPWENHFYFVIGAAFLILAMFRMTANFRRNRREAMRRPTRAQMFVEMIVDSLDNFVKGILGEENGRRYLPFIGTMFLLILTFNLMGLIPLMRAPSAALIITLSLALTTFLFTQYTAWVKLGPLTYLHHLCGSPQSGIQWVLAPLLILLEMVSDFIAKPLSLALRLFGNVLGKDILLGSFLFMGIGLVGAFAGPLGQYVGVPLTIPFYFLGILLGLIQALVFATLSCIYIMLVLPHDHDHEHEHEGGEEAHAH